jgi:hypothetical protein
MEGSVELARQHWAEGHRRLVRSKDGDPRLHAQMLGQIDVVTAGLRARVGKTFTLGELAAAYSGADDWARAAVEERAEEPGELSSVSTAADAAFHLYSRGARDYRP